MARGRKEARLGKVGVVRLGLRKRERGVEAREFLGALAHPALQRRVGAFQRLGGANALGDVGEHRHDAAIRHPVRAHVDHQSAFGEPFEIGGARPCVMRHAGAHEGLAAAALQPRAVGHRGEDFAQARADMHALRRHVENFTEAPVPADQPRLGVENRNALAHMLERGLQQFAIVMDRGIRLVQQLQRRLARHRALAQQQ